VLKRGHVSNNKLKRESKERLLRSFSNSLQGKFTRGFDIVTTAIKSKNSSTQMLDWQYKTLLGEVQQVELHETGDCPCVLNDLIPQERCLGKHLLNIATLSAETASMDKPNRDWLLKLADEATEKHEQFKEFICHKDDLPPLAEWGRSWRKNHIEPVYYVCSGKKAKLQDALGEIAALFSPRKTTENSSEKKWCPGIKTVSKDLGKLNNTLSTARKRITELKQQLETPLNICAGQAEMFAPASGVLDPYGSRCRDAKTGHWSSSGDCGFQPTGNKTTALGMDNVTRYELEFRVVELDSLVVSNDPFTFKVNPNYPQELQPRLRERAATQIQVEKIASNLKPDALITDFHVIDRGSPIVGPDMIVEAGNGRIMGLMRAAAEHPDQYDSYVDALEERIRDYGLNPKDLESIKHPVLVRVRISEVDRVKFAQEANAMATISPSAIENARTDAANISIAMLRNLQVAENESIEDALRAPKNQAFARQFLATLPEMVQAALIDSKGYLNRDGVHRMAMAIFVSAFQGDTGLRLAEKAFETVDMDVRNIINAIARSIGKIAEAEALTHSKQRPMELSIADDLAQTVVVYAAIKNNPSLTVEKYFAQSQMFTRELTDFQEKMLVVIDQYRRSSKKLGAILAAYAESVINLPPTSQASLIPTPEPTKEELWERAVSISPDQVEYTPAMLQDIASLFDVSRRVSCDMPAMKYRYLLTFFSNDESESVSRLFDPVQTAEKERKIDQALARLEDGIKNIIESDNFRSYLETLGKFHDYSLGNIMLIGLQMPSASRIAGFNTWKELGRYVKTGSRGIMILAPCFLPKPKRSPEEKAVESTEEETEAKEVQLRPAWFKVVYVFDISQTDGKELPSVYVPVIQGEETKHLFDLGVNLAGRYGVELITETKIPVSSGTMGYYMPATKQIWLSPNVSTDQRTKTLFHEIAHHKAVERYGRGAEIMAESVAYAVCSHFGFDTGVRSFPYIAGWAEDIKMLKIRLDNIRIITQEIVADLESLAQMNERALSIKNCTTLKVHDDGDKTVKCGRTLYVTTTDGKVFKEVRKVILDTELEEANEALKSIREIDL
jgi:hypothetical protein